MSQRPIILLQYLSAVVCAVILLLSLHQAVYADVPPGSYLSAPYHGTTLINQCYWSGHEAYDYNLVYQPVLASASGTVIRVDWWDDTCHHCNYGLHIYIQHSNGHVTRYAHLSSTTFELVESGGTASVTAGTIIGTSGNTGMSTAPHLHFELRNGNHSGNIAINPGAENASPCYQGNILWKDGQWAGHPLPMLADSGQIEVDDTTDNSGGFSKGSGGLFNNPCTGDCGNWTRFLVGYFGDMYRRFVNGSVVDGWARWNPAIPNTANYEVWVHTPAPYATSWQAPFHIAYQAGEAKGRIDQAGLFNRWVSLGIYRMSPGHYVYSTDASGESTGVHCGSSQNCELGADAVRLINRSTLHQILWRGDQFWSRTIPMTNGAPQWGSPSSWVGPGSIGYMPGSGTLQTESMYIVGDTLWFTTWRNNQGYYKTIPIIYGQIQWANASNWTPVNISTLAGAGDMQTQSEYIVGSKIWQSYWRGDQGWWRTIPIVNGVPQWSQASPWPQTPLSLSQIAGSGPMVAQTDYVIGNLLYQFHWRYNNGTGTNEGWHRTVPIDGNGNPDWARASSWRGLPFDDGVTGSVAIQSRSDFVMP